ncbi:hypothetical protein SUGI_0197170 [Cryptomeria japonica]|nr:hypothetical protein SUGI_0197170 [Cryptomeria japonica]
MRPNCIPVTENPPPKIKWSLLLGITKSRALIGPGFPTAVTIIVACCAADNFSKALRKVTRRENGNRPYNGSDWKITRAPVC